MKTVLVTGAFGNTAKPIIELLIKNDYKIIAIDLPTVDCPNWLSQKNVHFVIGSICDPEILNQAMMNTDAVIHLAVLTDNIEYINNPASAFNVNAFGTYNVLQCANRLNIPKVIIASSAPVHNINKFPISKTIDYICSDDIDFTYDLTKHLQELISRDHAATFNMNIIVLRLGHIVDGLSKTDLHGIPLNEVKYCRGGWVCQYDVARAFLRALESDLQDYNLFHIIGSFQAEKHFDILSAKNKLGFICKENFTEY